MQMVDPSIVAKLRLDAFIKVFRIDGSLKDQLTSIEPVNLRWDVEFPDADDDMGTPMDLGDVTIYQIIRSHRSDRHKMIYHATVEAGYLENFLNLAEIWVSNYARTGALPS